MTTQMENRTWQQSAKAPQQKVKRPPKPKSRSKRPVLSRLKPVAQSKFEEFRCTKFAPYIFTGAYSTGNGCGASALALLTGVHPISIPYREDWDARYMLSFLLNKKFNIYKLTMDNLTNCETTQHPITKSHVVLASIKMLKEEATWVVLHGETMYHNFEITSMNPYDLINHPLINMYLVKHPTWDKAHI